MTVSYMWWDEAAQYVETTSSAEERQAAIERYRHGTFEIEGGTEEEIRRQIAKWYLPYGMNNKEWSFFVE